MENSEAVTKICPFMTGDDNSKPYVYCLCEKCMAWQDDSNMHKEDKEGYCKRLEK